MSSSRYCIIVSTGVKSKHADKPFSRKMTISQWKHSISGTCMRDTQQGPRKRLNLSFDQFQHFRERGQNRQWGCSIRWSCCNSTGHGACHRRNTHIPQIGVMQVRGESSGGTVEGINVEKGSEFRPQPHYSGFVCLRERERLQASRKRPENHEKNCIPWAAKGTGWLRIPSLIML